MLNFEISSKVISLPDLLSDRWSNIEEIKEVKNFFDITELIKYLFNKIKIYINLNNIMFNYIFDPEKELKKIGLNIDKQIDIPISQASLNYDRSLSRHEISIKEFFKEKITKNKLAYREYIKYSISDKIHLHITALDDIIFPNNSQLLDNNVNLKDIFFQISDIEEFEKENHVNINNHETKELIRDKEVIKEIEKPQKQQPINQDDNYKYSEALKPYNDIILAFQARYDYLTKKLNKKPMLKSDIQDWLNNKLANPVKDNRLEIIEKDNTNIAELLKDNKVTLEWYKGNIYTNKSKENAFSDTKLRVLKELIGSHYKI